MGLARLLRERASAIEADLLQYYGLRLTDWLGPEPPSWRLLYTLISQLPDEARTRGGWGYEHEMAALQAELTHGLLVAVLAMGGVKQRPKPLRIPRPYETDRGSRKTPVRGDRINTLSGLKALIGKKAKR